MLWQLPLQRLLNSIRNSGYMPADARLSSLLLFYLHCLQKQKTMLSLSLGRSCLKILLLPYLICALSKQVNKLNIGYMTHGAVVCVLYALIAYMFCTSLLLDGKICNCFFYYILLPFVISTLLLHVTFAIKEIRARQISVFSIPNPNICWV